MQITCPECGTVYEVEDKLVPSAGVNVKCVNCNNAFFVKKEKPAAEEISLAETAAQPAEPAVEEAPEKPASTEAGALEAGLGVSSEDKWAPAEPSGNEAASGLAPDKTEREKSAGDADIAVEKPAPDMAEDFGDVSLDIGDRFDDFSFDGSEDSDMAADLMELQLGSDMIDYSIIDQDIDALLDDSPEIGEIAKEAVEEPDPYENLPVDQLDISGLPDEKAETGESDELSDIESAIGKSAEEAIREEASDEEPTGGQFEMNDITIEETPEAESIKIEPEETLLDETETDIAPLEIGEELPDVEETAKEAEKPREEAVEEISVDELSLEEISIETEEPVGAETPEPAIEEESGSGEGEPSEIGLDLSEEDDMGFEQPADEPLAEGSAVEPGEESESGEPATGLAEPEPADVETGQPVATEEDLFEATAEPAEAFAGEEGLDELIHEETEAKVNYVSSVTAKPALLFRFTAVDILVAVAVVTVAVAVLAFLLEKIGLLRAVQ